MTKEIVIQSSCHKLEIALLEDKRLIEFSDEKGGAVFTAGEVHLGKVGKIMPTLNSAFIKIGAEKDGFIHYNDLGDHFDSFSRLINGKSELDSFNSKSSFKKDGNIADVLKTGDLILVQITKEPISTKGPRLTSEISIAGRNMVLMPFSRKTSISQKIQDGVERKRLTAIFNSLLSKNYGVIVRTACSSKKTAEIDKELRPLIAQWKDCIQRIHTASAPSLIHRDQNKAIALLRDRLNVDYSGIYVDDESIAEEIKDYLKLISPSSAKIVKLYTGKVSIFENYNVTKQIKAAFGKTVLLKQGSYIIIEQTEALMSIDVNSGTRIKNVNNSEEIALSVNIMAAEEIARQLKLRDIGGLIVVDFIDMHVAENRQLLFEKMRDLLALDKTKSNLAPLSKFCLMEMTRQRVRPITTIDTTGQCPSCNGTGKVTPTENLDTIVEESIADLKNNKANVIVIDAHPYMISHLKEGLFSKRVRLSFKYWVFIALRKNPTIAINHVVVIGKRNGTIIRK